MDISAIIKAIKQGKVLVLPTDTVYGLVCDATNKKAVEKIFKIKKRPKSKPLPIFVKDIKMAKKLAVIDKNQERFLKKVWPGPTTAVLRRKAKSAKRKIYGVAKKTIAIRIPQSGLLLGVAEQLNRPLAQTSANISGKPASGNIKEVIKQFEGQRYQPDLIVGHSVSNRASKRAKPSKVIDLTKTPYKVLRP